jgi:hypothetical protein
MSIGMPPHPTLSRQGKDKHDDVKMNSLPLDGEGLGGGILALIYWITAERAYGEIDFDDVSLNPDPLLRADS